MTDQKAEQQPCREKELNHLSVRAKWILTSLKLKSDDTSPTVTHAVSHIHAVPTDERLWFELCCQGLKDTPLFPHSHASRHGLKAFSERDKRPNPLLPNLTPYIGEKTKTTPSRSMTNTQQARGSN